MILLGESADGYCCSLVGLLAVIRVDCDDPRDLHYQATPWFNFVNPGILIILYYLLASHIRQWKGYTVGLEELADLYSRRNNDDVEYNPSFDVYQRIKNPFTTYRVSSRIRSSNEPPESVLVTNPVQIPFNVSGHFPSYHFLGASNIIWP